MGKAFWIASGVGLVLALGLWVGLTGRIRGQVGDLQGKVGTHRKTLHKWANEKYKDIVNQSFLDEEAAYKQKLADAKDALLKQMREKNIDIRSKEFPTPPPTDSVAGFREWLTELTAKRNEKLRASGIILPSDRVDLGEVRNWDEVEKEDIQRILLEYLVSSEVLRALAEATASVHYRTKTLEEKTGKEEPFEKDSEKKVLEIVMLRFDEVAARGAKAKPKPGAEETPGLVKQHGFTVKFNAHYGPAFDFIRKLEDSKVGIFAVRSTDIRRVDRLDVRAEKSQAFANAMGDEAPVAVEMRASLLEFAGKEGG